MPASEPILNVPRAVTLAAAVMLAVQTTRVLLPFDEGIKLFLSLAFIPARYAGAASEIPGGYLASVTSFLTYMVVHGNWMHLLINVLWMLAFGTAIARRMTMVRFYGFSILCGVAGALTHLVLHWGEMSPMVGASAAISGQMAGAMRFIFFARGAPGDPAPDFAQVPMGSLGETLRNPKIMAFVVFWVGLNAYFGLTSLSFGGGPDSEIAWEAHIRILCGLFVFGFFDRVRNAVDASRVR